MLEASGLPFEQQPPAVQAALQALAQRLVLTGLHRSNSSLEATIPPAVLQLLRRVLLLYAATYTRLLDYASSTRGAPRACRAAGQQCAAAAALQSRCMMPAVHAATSAAAHRLAAGV